MRCEPCLPRPDTFGCHTLKPTRSTCSRRYRGGALTVSEPLSLAAHASSAPHPPHVLGLTHWPDWQQPSPRTRHPLPAEPSTRRRVRPAAWQKHRPPCHGTWPARAAQFSTSSASTDRMCATRLRDEVTLLSAVLPDGIDVSISPTATGIKNAPCPKGGATPLRSGRHRDVNPAHAYGRFSAIGHHNRLTDAVTLS